MGSDYNEIDKKYDVGSKRSVGDRFHVHVGAGNGSGIEL